jgi:small subunit ribosomal protein S7
MPISTSIKFYLSTRFTSDIFSYEKILKKRTLHFANPITFYSIFFIKKIITKILSSHFKKIKFLKKSYTQLKLSKQKKKINLKKRAKKINLKKPIKKKLNKSTKKILNKSTKKILNKYKFYKHLTLKKKDLYLLISWLFLVNTYKGERDLFIFLQKRVLFFLIKNENILNFKEDTIYFLKHIFFNCFKGGKSQVITAKSINTYKKHINKNYPKRKIFSYNKLYDRLVGLIIKDGKKLKAQKIVDTAFFKMQKQTNLHTNTALSQLITKLQLFVETRSIRVRRTFHLVPLPVNEKRKFYLIGKILLFAISQSEKKRISTSEKLQLELLNTLIKKPKKKNETDILLSASLLKKQADIKAALANRANSHFRW